MKGDEFAMEILSFLGLVFLLHNGVAIDIDDINISNCTDGSPCEDFVSKANPSSGNSNGPTEKSSDEIFTVFTTEAITNENFTTAFSQTDQVSSTTAITISSTTSRNDVDQTINHFPKKLSEMCTCDLKISSCDVNCCCDPDCNDFQMSAFSGCDNHRPKMYDSRYCYTKNFIQRNNTQFILERLASNLFCIAYDNLPPIYGISEVPTLQNRRDFEQSKYSINLKKYGWHFPDITMPLEFNFSSNYQHKNNVWKIHNNVLKPMELPQSGLDSRCTFGRKVKYLETLKWTCLQTDLSNNNAYLFTETYNDLRIIASPHLFNSTFISSDNHESFQLETSAHPHKCILGQSDPRRLSNRCIPSCPINVCLSLETFHCWEIWSNCSKIKTVEQSCTSGKCKNVIKRVRYTFFHNGTSGIRSIELRLMLSNVSEIFYQHFEVTYDWTGEGREQKYLRSGSPGYTFGKPIIIGFSIVNASNDATKGNISVNSSNYHLKLAMGGKNGNCMSGDRYVVRFNENVKLRCNVEVETSNFSSSVTCMRLQNETLKLMLEEALEGVTQVEMFRTYVSKIGDTSMNDRSKWSQILLDRMPRNVVTGFESRDKIRCSALVTSMHLEFLYTILPNHEEIDNYKIAGVALTFSEAKDLAWPKCVEKNCSNHLNLELTSLVTFTDISTPSMYYYAGGPNLDISLPYDFFYPFMSKACTGKPLNVLLVLTFFPAIYNYVFPILAH